MSDAADIARRAENTMRGSDKDAERGAGAGSRKWDRLLSSAAVGGRRLTGPDRHDSSPARPLFLFSHLFLFLLSLSLVCCPISHGCGLLIRLGCGGCGCGHVEAASRADGWEGEMRAGCDCDGSACHGCDDAQRSSGVRCCNECGGG